MPSSASASTVHVDKCFFLVGRIEFLDVTRKESKYLNEVQTYRNGYDFKFWPKNLTNFRQKNGNGILHDINGIPNNNSRSNCNAPPQQKQETSAFIHSRLQEMNEILNKEENEERQHQHLHSTAYGIAVSKDPEYVQNAKLRFTIFTFY